MGMPYRLTSSLYQLGVFTPNQAISTLLPPLLTKLVAFGYTFKVTPICKGPNAGNVVISAYCQGNDDYTALRSQLEREGVTL